MDDSNKKPEDKLPNLSRRGLLGLGAAAAASALFPTRALSAVAALGEGAAAAGAGGAMFGMEGGLALANPISYNVFILDLVSKAIKKTPDLVAQKKFGYDEFQDVYHYLNRFPKMQAHDLQSLKDIATKNRDAALQYLNDPTNPDDMRALVKEALEDPDFFSKLEKSAADALKTLDHEFGPEIKEYVKQKKLEDLERKSSWHRDNNDFTKEDELNWVEAVHHNAKGWSRGGPGAE